MDITITLTDSQAAGLTKALAAYNDGNEALTAEQYVAAVLKPQADAWAQTILSIPSASFILRFTATEIATIMGAAAQVPELQAYLDRLSSEPTVNLSNAEAIAGVLALEAYGLIAAGRAAEIMVP